MSTDNARRVAVVVDAYSTGARLAPRFIAEGLDVVHVQSNPNESPFYIERLRTQDFLENVVHQGDLEATAAAVARYDPAFVVVGSEPGVLPQRRALRAARPALQRHRPERARAATSR